MKKTLKLNNIRLNKKGFHKSKEPNDLMSVIIDQILVSVPLCIALPQIAEYIKYFENGSKSISFLIKDDEVWEKYKKR